MVDTKQQARAYWEEKNLGDQFDLVTAYIKERNIEQIEDLPAVSLYNVLEAYSQALPLVGDHDLYLIGSYATGYYVDESTPEEVKLAFIEMGLKRKWQSDVDFYCPGVKGPIRMNGFDILAGYRGKKKILMQKQKVIVVEPATQVNSHLKKWDYSKVPEGLVPQIKEALKSKNQGKLVQWHHAFKPSNENFCCGGGKYLIYHFEQIVKFYESE